MTIESSIPTLKKTLEIVHSSFLLILLVFFHHIFAVTSSQNLLAFLFYFSTKVIVYSAIFGTIIDIASQHSPDITINLIKNNCKKYWILTTAFLGFEIVFGFLTTSTIKNFTNSNFQFFLPEIITLYGISTYIIKDKFSRIVPQKSLLTNFTFIDITTLLIILSGMLVCTNHKLILGHDLAYFQNLPSAIYYYLYFVIFTYIVFLYFKKFPEIEQSFDNNKELYLIYPVSGSIFAGLASSLTRLYPPIFIVLKALTPSRYKIKEFNRTHWKNRFYKTNKLVAITCFTSNSPEAYKIAKEFKRMGSTVIMGGPHVSYLPQEALKYCDAVVIGAAEGSWEQIIEDYENNCLKKEYTQLQTKDFNLPVHNELLKSSPDIASDFLETTRGCKFKCHFCTIPGLSNNIVSKYPIPQLIELVQKISKSKKSINFIDNNIYSDPGYAKELFKALIPLKIKWYSQCTIDIAKNDETLDLAQKSGARGILIGYETFGNSEEKSQGGKFSMNQKYLEYSKKIKQKGIGIKAHFIFGFDSDRLRSMWDLYKFAFCLWPKFSIISMLTPLPGSQTFYEMFNHNRITNYNWRYYDSGTLVFKHPKINTTLLRYGFPILKYFTFFTTNWLGLTLITFFLTVLYLMNLNQH